MTILQFCNMASDPLTLVPVPSASTLHILDIWIAERYRPKGFAQQAIDLIVTQSKQRGVDAVALNVFSSNTPAVALYEKFGFKPYSQSFVLATSVR